MRLNEQEDTIQKQAARIDQQEDTMQVLGMPYFYELNLTKIREVLVFCKKILFINNISISIRYSKDKAWGFYVSFL